MSASATQGGHNERSVTCRSQWSSGSVPGFGPRDSGFEFHGAIQQGSCSRDWTTGTAAAVAKYKLERKLHKVAVIYAAAV